MRVEVRFHGELRKYNGNREARILELPAGATVYDALQRTGVPLEEIALVALNGSRTDWNVTLKDGDSIKVFQMVAGG